ncbi:MAG: septum formation initiator family protein [Actinomycetota bacterium]
MAKQGGRPRTERVAVRLPGETPFARWLRSIRLSGFAIIALGLIIVCVVVLAPSLRVYIEQRQQISQLQSQVADAKRSLSSLKSQKARWSDPNYIEAQARSRLNYVFPGEYSYLVINDVPGASTADGQPISDKLQTTQVDWVESMLSSVFTAGLTDQTPDQLVAPNTK